MPLTLLIALQFLTRLPVRLPGMPSPQQQARSLLWYPAVGLLLGAALVLLQRLLGEAPAALQAALLLALWVSASGALHLDGLADTADAWVGGLGDRERTLAIMKDPRSGPMAVVALVLLLLLKFVALLALVERGEASGLLLAPLLGRTALLALFFSTPYVRPNGLGRGLAEHLPRPAARTVLLAVALACPLLFGAAGVRALAVAVPLFLYLRHCLRTRLGGTTGDTAGALLEVLECAVLVALAL